MSDFLSLDANLPSEALLQRGASEDSIESSVDFPFEADFKSIKTILHVKYRRQRQKEKKEDATSLKLKLSDGKRQL